jgi:hypothetical protein
MGEEGYTEWPLHTTAASACSAGKTEFHRITKAPLLIFALLKVIK